MGLVLLQDAFDLIRATPIAVSRSPADSVENLIIEFSIIVSDAKHRVGRWETDIEKLMSEIPIVSKIYISEVDDTDEIVSDLEKLRVEIEDRVEKIVRLQERSYLALEGAHLEARLFFGEEAKKYIKYSEIMQRLIEEDLEISSKFLDFLTEFLAEIDPQARGGPTFDNADDLTAYLNR